MEPESSVSGTGGERGGPERVRPRREFLVWLVRGAILGGIAAVAALLGRRGARTQGPCVRKGLCPGCPSLPDCCLPRAEIEKRSRRD